MPERPRPSGHPCALSLGGGMGVGRAQNVSEEAGPRAQGCQLSQGEGTPPTRDPAHPQDRPCLSSCPAAACPLPSAARESALSHAAWPRQLGKSACPGPSDSRRPSRGTRPRRQLPWDLPQLPPCCPCSTSPRRSHRGAAVSPGRGLGDRHVAPLTGPCLALSLSEWVVSLTCRDGQTATSGTS